MQQNRKINMVLLVSNDLLKTSLHSLQLAGVVAGLLVVYVLVHYYLASQRPTNFPPGPKTLPFLGNLHQFPPTKAFLR